ncbi:MAG: hypothetical protein CMH30_01100 [Micavibrio sp.]|nr:hypothetical protein [Micavibrio sp.]|tara:strand:+ start:2968 stop:3648 length:681 start_codon:yes stop_codon:yes gene_type:complete
MLDTSLLPLFLAVIVLCLKPGPYMMAFMSMAIDGKWKSMLVFWIGSVIAGTATYFFLLGTLSLLPPNFGFIFLFMKAAAAVMFVSMGLSALTQSIDQTKEAAAETKEKITTQSFLATIFAGFFLTLSNPYDLTFILAAVPTLAGTTHFSFMDILIIRGIVVTADILMLACYCVPLLFIRRAFSNERLRQLKLVSAIAMIVIGIFIFGNMIYHVTTQGDLYNIGLLG